MADFDSIVVPLIQQDEEGNLIRRSPREAYKNAIKTGDYIEFPSAEEASWFAKNYKSVWEE